MTNEEYQLRTKATAIYPTDNPESVLAYLVLGVASEAGEVAGKLKKQLRGDFKDKWKEFSEQLDAEMGDVLWYISQYCNESGTTISTLMEMNIKKLEGRAVRKTLRGDGDER